MKTLRFPLLLALAATTLLAACDKDKEAAKPQTPTELLVGKSWKLTAQTASPAIRRADGRLITDVYAVSPEYDRDDLIRFEKPDAFTYDEGPTKLNETKPQNYTGTWEFSEGDKVLTARAAGLGTNSYDVLEITATTMKLSGVRMEEDGINHTHTFTFTKQ